MFQSYILSLCVFFLIPDYLQPRETTVTSIVKRSTGPDPWKWDIDVQLWKKPRPRNLKIAECWSEKAASSYNEVREVDDRPGHPRRAAGDGQHYEPGKEEDQDVGRPDAGVHEPLRILVQIRRRWRLHVQLRHSTRTTGARRAGFQSLSSQKPPNLRQRPPPADSPFFRSNPVQRRPPGDRMRKKREKTAFFRTAREVPIEGT